MPELENVKPQKTAGYVSRNRTTNQDRIKKDEEELKELMEESGKVQEEIKKASLDL